MFAHSHFSFFAKEMMLNALSKQALSKQAPSKILEEPKTFKDAWNKNGIIFIALYVNDCLSIGHEMAIDLMVDELRKFNLKLKVDKELKDYLSCEIHFLPNRKSIVLHL